MAGSSEKPVLGGSGLDVGAGEKLIKLGVAEVVFVVAADDAGDVVKPNPDGVAGTGAEAEVVLAVGKVYAGGASDLGALEADAAGVVPNEKPPVGFSEAFASTGVAGFVGVWKLKVALLSVDLVGVPKLNPPPPFTLGGSLGLGIAVLGGSILPKPASLIGSLSKAVIPLGLGVIVTSGFFSSTLGSAGGASTVSFTFVGTLITGFGGSSSSSKSSLRQLSISDSFDFSTCFKAALSLFRIGDFSFGLIKLIRPLSSSSSSCSSLSLTTGLTSVSSYFLLNRVILGCVGFGRTGGTISGTLLTICGNGADSIRLTFVGSRDSTFLSVGTVAFSPTGVATLVANV